MARLVENWEHLEGKLTVGTYAIRRDDTCVFLAADFDENQWAEDAGAYLAAARELGVEAALDRLTQRERLVVKLRFGIGYERSRSFSELAEELGVSQERARQILNRAIFKMRTPRLRKLIEPLID